MHLDGEQTEFLPTPVSPFLKLRKIVGDGNFVERNFSLQNVILHWAITQSNKNFFDSYFIRKTCLHQKGAFLKMRVTLKNEKLGTFLKDKKKLK